MIVEWEGDDALVDREALAVWTGRSPHTIRARLTPTKTHASGRPLYLYRAAAEQLAAIPQRAPRRRTAET